MKTSPPETSLLPIFLAAILSVHAGVFAIAEEPNLSGGLPPEDVQPMVVRGTQAGDPVSPVTFDGDLRSLPKKAPWRPGDPQRLVHQLRPSAGPAPPNLPSDERSDPLLAVQTGALTRRSTTPGFNIPGIAYTGSLPPDTIGDVGPNHFIQAVNGSPGSVFKVFDKSGSALTGEISMGTLGVGGCTMGFSDPVVVYDALADRWVLLEMSLEGFPTSGSLCVYVSQSPDPVAGGWQAYEFVAPNFPDFPKLGVWPSAYLISTNEFNDGGFNAAYALDRDAMLSGLPASWQRFSVPKLSGFNFHSMTVADHEGAEPPPAGTPGLFLRHRDTEHHGGITDPDHDYLELWELDIDWQTSANSAFTGPLLVPTAEFDSSVCETSGGMYHCIDQPGVVTRLDARPEVLMWRLGYHNRGSYQALTGVFTVDAGNDQAALRWFELRDDGGGWAVFQEGTHAPDSQHRWMGSLAMDAAGNMALGYSLSSLSTLPELRTTGRESSDQLGLMTEIESTLAAGLGVQTSTERWGDYHAMTVDPNDGCTFWLTGQYLLADGTWATRIGTFAFDSCLGGIFSDNFESGDSSLWSVTVP